MAINTKIIKELENTYGRSSPTGLKRYLLIKYAERSFSYEHSKQDLYTSIRNDIRDYAVGKSAIMIKSPSER